MDYVQRLIAALLLFTAAIPINASAADNAYYAGTSGFYSKSAVAACQSRVAGRGDGAVYDKVVAKPSDMYQCWWSTTNPQEGTQYNYTELPALYCPQGQEFGTTSCVPAAPPCPAGEGSMNGAFYSGSCINGCEKEWNGQQFEMLGVRYYGYLANTGSSCATSANSMQGAWDSAKAAKEASDAAAKAAKAAADKAAADAKNAADKAASAAAAKAAEAAKQAAEDAEKTAQESKDAAAKAGSDPNATQAQKDAANSKAASDAAEAAAKNEAAATAVGNAAAAQKSETPEKVKDFCETNPNSMICKNSQINIGSCNKGSPIGFQCDGDAIFCGIAKSQLMSYCASQEKDDALVTSYDTMKTENGSKSPSNSANIGNINLPTSLNASSPYGAQCNPDVTVLVASSTVTLPFSAWCPYLMALGYLFLSMAYISGAVIISRT